MKKWNYYYVVSVIELLFLLIAAIDISSKENISYTFLTYELQADENQPGKICTEQIPLSEGIYQVTIQYEKDKGSGVCYAAATETDINSLYTDRVQLSGAQESRSFDIYVKHAVTDFRIITEQQENQAFTVKNIELQTAWNSRIYQVFCLFLKLMLINLLVLLIFVRKRNFSWSYEVMGILVITLLASIALFGRYYLYGHDLYFHMYRIEGLKEGLLEGQFPVKMHSGWFNGYGYPVSVMYGDTLLYFPACLRLLGVSLQNAYKAYIAAVNLGTAAIAYYVFYRISKNKHIAVLGSCVYTLAPYRLSCIYLRAAMGEYSAMMFLPLVVLCFWYVLEVPKNQKFEPVKLIAPVIGFSGLIQTHIISCFMAALMIVLFCVFAWKQVFQKNSFLYLLKTAGITVLLNLWFLLPFFDYFGEDFKVKHMNTQMTNTFQTWGADMEELLAVYWNGTLSSSWGGISALSGKFAKPVGSAFLAALVVAVLLYHKGKMGKLEKKTGFCILCFCLTAFMASSLFPHYALGKAIPFLGKLVVKIQFPWRFLTMTILFGSLLTVIVLKGINNSYGKQLMLAVAALLALISISQGTQLETSALYRGDTSLAYDLEAYSVKAVTDGEYLYEGVQGEDTEAAQAPSASGAEVLSYERNGLRAVLNLKSYDKEAYVLLPMFCYPGYEAIDGNSGKKMMIERSEDNSRIRINLPAEYEGTVTVQFKKPLTWRAGELVSLLTLLYLCFGSRIKRRALAGEIHRKQPA